MKFLISAFIILLFSFNSLAEVNVRIDPLRLLTKTWNVEVDFPISTAWTLVPSIRYMDGNSDGYDVKAYGLGVRGNYFFEGSVFKQGWYFGPSVSYVDVEVVDQDTVLGKLTGSSTGVGFLALFGYHWIWEAFNMNLGFGPGYVTVSKIKLKDDSGAIEEDYDGYHGATLALEFTLGWKF